MSRKPVGESEDTEWVNAPEMARLLGVTSRMIGYYEDAGMPSNGEEGRKRLFPVNQCRQWWLAYKQEIKEKPDGDFSESDARTRKLLVEAKLKEIELLKEQKVLVEIDYATEKMEQRLTVIRQKLDVIPSKFGQDFVNISTVGEAMNALKNMMVKVNAEILNEFASLPDPLEESDD